MIKGRVAILWLLMFMVAAALLEAVSYVTLHVAEAIRPGVVLELFMDQHFAAISPESARKFRDGLYHPDLGWDYEPLSHYAVINSAGDPYRMSWDASGARDDGFFDYELFMATYGDSFTVGEKVNNDETWQYFLSKSIDKRIVNFGASGYGTDQALIKFKHHLGKCEIAPFTVLAILEENIRRTINVFRPFFYRAGDGAHVGIQAQDDLLIYSRHPTQSTSALQ